jgi:hypothetical protein
VRPTYHTHTFDLLLKSPIRSNGNNGHTHLVQHHYNISEPLSHLEILAPLQANLRLVSECSKHVNAACESQSNCFAVPSSSIAVGITALGASLCTMWASSAHIRMVHVGFNNLSQIMALNKQAVLLTKVGLSLELVSVSVVSLLRVNLDINIPG